MHALHACFLDLPGHSSERERERKGEREREGEREGEKERGKEGESGRGAQTSKQCSVLSFPYLPGISSSDGYEPAHPVHFVGKG